MQLSAEITYYPFKENVVPQVKLILEKINSYSNWQVQTFPSATLVMGDCDTVFDNIKHLTKWSYNNHGECVFICKFLPEFEAL